MGVASFGNLWLTGWIKYAFLVAVLLLACWLYRGELKTLMVTAGQIIAVLRQKLQGRRGA